MIGYLGEMRKLKEAISDRINAGGYLSVRSISTKNASLFLERGMVAYGSETAQDMIDCVYRAGGKSSPFMVIAMNYESDGVNLDCFIQAVLEPAQNGTTFTVHDAWASKGGARIQLMGGGQ